MWCLRSRAFAVRSSVRARSDDVSLVRASVRRLCKAFPGEYWRRCDKAAKYPSEFVAALGDAGFLNILVPDEYGGGGLGLVEVTIILYTPPDPEPHQYSWPRSKLISSFECT